MQFCVCASEHSSALGRTFSFLDFFLASAKSINASSVVERDATGIFVIANVTETPTAMPKQILSVAALVGKTLLPCST
jgi:hypothetical protein